MRLTADGLHAVRSAGLLPVFGYALLAALVVGLAVGGFVAWKWMAGAQAMQENAQLRADAKDWADIANRQRQNTTEQAAEIDAAIARLNAISQGREDDREAIRQLAETLGTSLGKVAAANPALRDLDLGADFLRHWNDANAGPGAAAPAAGRAGEPGAAVPRTPAGEERERDRAPRPTRPGSAAVPRLPKRERASYPDRAGVAVDGVEVVLRRGREGEQQAGRLHG